MEYHFSEQFALEQDQLDPLRSFSDQFLKPEHNGKKAIYFCGNSLGLQPKTTKKAIEAILDQWHTLAVDGHFYGKEPWIDLHQKAKPMLGQLLGAKQLEVSPMNNLTTNLHMMMVSFYQPTETRYKVLIEKGAFPSDSYAVDSQIKFHGYNIKDALVEVSPPKKGELLCTEDILNAINEHAGEVALVLLPGIQYYTGQLLDIEKITNYGHKVGASVGIDLAHAIGNVPLKLHDWGVDFAVWCTYKYLNSGPGSISGIFVHEKHAFKTDLPRFAGWWGHNRERRFLMERNFDPIPGAEGWHQSNIDILTLASHVESLNVFEQAGLDQIFEKRNKLTGFLEYLLHQIPGVNIITPDDKKWRGSQLSLSVDGGKEIFNKLLEKGIIGDWREPNVIRIAPVPLYNTFHEVFRFAQALKEIIEFR